MGTSIANVDTTELLGPQLEYGCSVFFQNELHIFGVNVKNPHHSDVSTEQQLVRAYTADNFLIKRFKILKLTSKCKFEYLSPQILGKSFKHTRCDVVRNEVWLCFGKQGAHSCETWTIENSVSKIADNSRHNHWVGILSIYENRPFAFSCMYLISCNYRVSVFIANHHTKEVELFNFGLNKWESKNEWKYPFRRG